MGKGNQRLRSGKKKTSKKDRSRSSKDIDGTSGMAMGAKTYQNPPDMRSEESTHSLPEAPKLDRLERLLDDWYDMRVYNYAVGNRSGFAQPSFYQFIKSKCAFEMDQILKALADRVSEGIFD